MGPSGFERFSEPMQLLANVRNERIAEFRDHLPESFCLALTQTEIQILDGLRNPLLDKRLQRARHVFTESLDATLHFSEDGNRIVIPDRDLTQSVVWLFKGQQAICDIDESRKPPSERSPSPSETRRATKSTR